MISIAQSVWSSPWSKLDQFLPILRLIYGVIGRKSVTYPDYLCCQAEEWFARGKYLIKFRSYGITNVQGRGRNELTLFRNIFGSFYLNSFAKDHGHFFSSSPLFFQRRLLHVLPELNIFRWKFWRTLTLLLEWIGTQWRFWAGVVVELSSEGGW